MGSIPAVVRSILAVVAGIAALTAISFAIESVANPLLLRMFPEALPNAAAIRHNQWAILFMIAYSSVCMVGGGYLTARLAPRLPLRHAVLMGAIQVGLNFMAMLDFRELAPLWVWIVGMVLAVPAAWAGGRLRVRHAGAT